LAAYAASLQAAIGAPAVSGVTITANAATGQLSIKGPSNMAITGNLMQDFTGTQSSYTLGTYTDPVTQVTTQATIDPATNLTITGPTVNGSTATITAPNIALMAQPVSAANYATALTNALTAAGITGVSVSTNGGQISIVGPSTMRLAGSVQQDMRGTKNDFAFHKDGTVDPTTNLTITGETAAGRKVTITPPSFATGETVAQYAADLNTAIAAAGIVNVTASEAGNQLSIVGANLTLSGGVSQDLATSTINYNFGASGQVNPATNLTITGPALVGGGTATIAPPAILPGESVAQYAADLTAALNTAGIKTGFGGVSVTANGSQLSIVGPATTLSTAGTASEDITATSINYSFAASGGKVATVDPATNLTITGPAIGGGTATTIAPKVVPGETLAQYAKAMNDAINAAGIAGAAVTSNAAGLLSIVGAGISTSGSVIQEPVGSTNAQGSLLFDASGNLVGPTADISGITFAGLSDGAANLDLTWGIYGQSGKPIISQVKQTSEVSSKTQDGYTSGGYNGFSIGTDGTVTASFLNGKTLDVGQLVLGSVANLQGLKAMGGGNFAATTASGTVTVGASGTSGLGTMEGGALEASNVNISAEFSNLIIAQRAFEANSKAVTTFDTVTQTTINMIR
jgi:flagellar hook protein FlgE